MRSHWANFIGQQPAKQLPQWHKQKAKGRGQKAEAEGKVEAARRKGFISMLQIEERREKIPVSFAAFALVDLLRRAMKYIHSRLIGLVLWGALNCSYGSKEASKYIKRK